MDEPLSMEEVLEQTEKCKIDVWAELQLIRKELSDGDARMGTIEDKLHNAEMQRTNNTEEFKEALHKIHGEIASYRNDFNNHDKHEIEERKALMAAIDNLTKQVTITTEETEENSNIIHEQIKKLEIDKAVEEALEASKAPYKDIKFTAIKAVVGMVAIALATSVWHLIDFITHLDKGAM